MKKVNDKQKDELWKQFKSSDRFLLLTKLAPYDQWEICFKAGIDSALGDDMVILKREEWENIKKRL